MTTRKLVDGSLRFALNHEQEKSEIEDSDDDTSFEDINKLLSMPLPSLTANKSRIPTDPNDEFLRLTTMVRAVYFSYLQKCLLTNYFLCYKEKDEDVPCTQLKECADHMELTAVRSALEATLYRQNMLKLITDIKTHTSERKAYKKLVIFLEAPSHKVDVGVQTNNSWAEVQRADHIQSICITSNCEEVSSIRQLSSHDNGDVTKMSQRQNVSPHLSYNKTASPTVNSTCFHEVEHNKFSNESDEEIHKTIAHEDMEINKIIVNEEMDINKMEVNEEMEMNNMVVNEEMEISNMVFNKEMLTEEVDIFNCVQDNLGVQMANNESCIQNEDENSQDSLLQHMEDMFCESDDSSDLMTLIEKHSGVTKANIDKEINKMCLETDSLFPQSSNNPNRVPKNNDSKKMNTVKSNNVKPANTSNGKYSFSYYKEMKNREANKSLPPQHETPEMIQKRRANSIWFVERVHQVSKLKAMMTELSLRDYRKYGRVKEKFIELFGDSDDEEMMPDSPICIEEHLTACKERIAPWIVQHLMPFYNKRRIKDRQLFKIVAKHIADMLILENTFPEEDCVSKYIETYFKNKTFIRTKQDVYL